MIFAILLATATAAPAAAPQTDYQAGIRAGKLLCSNPDPVNKKSLEDGVAKLKAGQDWNVTR